MRITRLFFVGFASGGWFCFCLRGVTVPISVFFFYASGGYFLSIAKESHQNASRNPMVSALPLSSARVAAQVLPKQGIGLLYSRCRFIGRLKGLTTLPSENSSPQSHCHSEETAEAPPVADTARWFRGSVPIFTPQRGWKPADTTVQTVRRLVVGIRIPQR